MSIDVSKYPTLEELEIGGKNLKTVTLGNQPNLKHLRCWYNAMTTLDISGCSQLVPIINDKNKELGETGRPFASTGLDGALGWFYGEGDNNRNVCIHKKMKLVIDKKGTTASAGKTTTSDDSVKKSETVTPTEDNTIVTSAKTTKTSADVGQSYTISAPGFKMSGFKSSNKKVATVTKTGKVVPKKAGKVTIMATTKRGNKKAKVKFTVSK